MKETLQQIIEQEVRRMLRLEEASLCHDPRTGFFTDCDDDGAVYSLTKTGAQASGVDDRFVARGKVKSKKDNQPPKLGPVPYGMNTSKTKAGGRKRISGTDITPKYSVSKYPKKYSEMNETYPELKNINLSRKIEIGELLSYLLGSLNMKTMTERKSPMDVACRKAGYITMAQAQQTILKSLNAFSRASKGELYKGVKS